MMTTPTETRTAAAVDAVADAFHAAKCRRDPCDYAPPATFPTDDDEGGGT